MLQKYLVDGASVAWLRRGEGMIGLGCYAWVEVAGPAEADAWWSAFVAGVSHECAVPQVAGMGPLAFGSFTFDPGNTAATSRLIVPRVVIGRRQGVSWITVIGDPETPPLVGAPPQVKPSPLVELVETPPPAVPPLVEPVETPGATHLVSTSSTSEEASLPLVELVETPPPAVPPLVEPVETPGATHLVSTSSTSEEASLPLVELVETPSGVRAVAPAGTTQVRAPRGVRVVSDAADEDRWRRRVAEAVHRIESNGLEKVVLARSVIAEASEPIDVRHLVDVLARDYDGCWTFSVDGLVGASPEMLVRRERGLATSRVLAGTIQRSGSEETDLKLAGALARSSKNLAEHELAVASVAGALAPLCSGMNVPESPYVLELPNVLHLATDVTAVAHKKASALRLAQALHPSAAVCGTPTSVARAAIAELEGLDRGRYSGPVGWIDARGDGEWAIALRCGMVDAADPRRIELFAGCGIVEGSDPDEELAETKAKLVPMVTALLG